MAEHNEPPDPSARVVAERTHLAIPSLPSWIGPTVEYLRQKAVLAGACQETRSAKLLIALHEAVTNAVVHGNLGVSSTLKEEGSSAFAEALAQRAANSAYAERVVDIVVECGAHACRWIITDQGEGFDVESVLARCTSEDPGALLASGRGILMMKSFLDDVHFDLGGRRVILTLSRDSGAEKRQATRVPLHMPFQVTPLSEDGTPQWGISYEAVSRNFSATGIAILQHHLTTSGHVLIGVATDRGIVQIPAQVKHSRAFGSGGIELGCQFVEATSPTSRATDSPRVAEMHRAVERILDAYRATELSQHERRVHPRVAYNQRVTIQRPGGEPLIVGFARDLSRGGISLICQHALAGELTITLNAEQPLRLHCRVVRCSLIQEGFYDVGAAFVGVTAEAC